MGVRRPLFRSARGRSLRALEPGQLRPELAYADARHPRREGFPDPLQPVAGRLQRAPAARHPLAAGDLPRREPLDPETAKLDPMVSRGPWLARPLAQRGWRSGAGPVRAAAYVRAAQDVRS